MSTFYFHYYEYFRTEGEPKVGLWPGLANVADCNEVHYTGIEPGLLPRAAHTLKRNLGVV